MRKKKELKKQEQVFSHDIFKLFIKVFIGMFIIGVIAMILMNIFDIGEDELAGNGGSKCKSSGVAGSGTLTRKYYIRGII